WRAWQAYHMNSNGWADIAYTSGICPHGYRFEGRGPGVRTSSNGTNHSNTVSLSTVYIAGDDDPLTDEAKLAFLDEANRLGLPLNRVHQDWYSTSCAGGPLNEWVRAGCPRPNTPTTPKD